MRSKLKLEIDALAVDSFDTTKQEAKRGTVFGEQCTCWTDCTCPGCPTCDHTACGQHTCGNTCGQHTCGNTCGATCGYTCYCQQTMEQVQTCFNITTCNVVQPCSIIP